MTDAELIELLRSKQICTGFKPDGHGDVDIVYGPDPVTVEAADRIEALTAERDQLREALDETAQILSQCTFETIRVHGQYIDRREAVLRARAALKGETP